MSPCREILNHNAKQNKSVFELKKRNFVSIIGTSIFDLILKSTYISRTFNNTIWKTNKHRFHLSLSSSAMKVKI